MKILLWTDLKQPYQDEFIRQLPEDSEIMLKSERSDADVAKALDDADVLVGNPPVEIMEEYGKNLKFWQLENVGFEQYKDLDFKGKVANIGDMSAAPCAETIVAGVLAFYRGVHSMVKNQLEAKWVGEQIEEQMSVLGEKQVILLGSGAIAVHVCKFLEAFGCSVQMTAKSDPKADIHSYEELLKSLPEIDLVINTLPGNLDKYVGGDFFEAMKEGALYANIGRGNTTDEAALIDALESGKLIGAVLDVTETEPLPHDSKLWKMGNVLLTQHTGAAHKVRDRDKAVKFTENINEFIKTGKVKDEIQLSDGY
ncbi:NAD(P)-dependent oxidoreductase [Dyadobacter sp. CY326]|uniref:NAD(P)-dependent oxidoreductase n=1 Tax=Dyadobacter sp. CY326 TaxID=2907300 RepID=UPI001F23366B|nr:NAD(P)-dependent oxidoreductase [Dyadobacter sp. CY326]MCE7065072.1 D-2-hydroxyacid dehydrogenase [Dyadobacter sp. CY326]